jgi:hypothetical protein
MTGVGQYKLANFEDWLLNMDLNGNQAIEKRELGELVGRVAICENFGRNS